MHWIYLIHEFHNMSWITEINELLNDILNYWDEPVLTVFNIDNYKKCYLSIISAYCYFIFLEESSDTEHWNNGCWTFRFAIIKLHFMYSIKLYSIKLTVLLHVLLYIWKNQPWYKQVTLLSKTFNGPLVVVQKIPRVPRKALYKCNK